jgi:ribokinase
VITVFGSANLDLIGTVSRIPGPGETVPGDKFSTAAGGKGANQALAARRAGAGVRLVGAVGTDAFADEATALLKADAVDLSSLRHEPGPTGIAMIFVDSHGENVIAILPGANGTVSGTDADTALDAMDGDDVLVVQQEVPQPATRRALELAKERGIVSLLNTAPYLPTTPEVAPLASILVANETEFALLCGGTKEPLNDLMRDWARKHGQTLIVTLGGDGARAATVGGELTSVAALPVTPVDTTGAGDTFVGYLAAGLDAGLDLEAAMRRAAAAGSLACLKPGAQPAIPYATDVDAALPA